MTFIMCCEPDGPRCARCEENGCTHGFRDPDRDYKYCSRHNRYHLPWNRCQACEQTHELIHS